MLRNLLREPTPGRDAVVYLGLGCFALVVALLTGQPSMAIWSRFAIAAYAVGTLGSALLAFRRARAARGDRDAPGTRDAAAERRWELRARTILLGLTAAMVTIAPLAYLATAGLAVSEVGILERAGTRLLETGTPYPDAEEIAAATGPRYIAYNVYLPVLALFGLPSAVFGEHVATDPRWYFALFAIAGFLATGRGVRPMLLVACTPPVALGLAIGSTDLPVLAMLCLALTSAESGRAGRAGVATGLAAAMKLHALPAVFVYFALVGALHGGRRALRYTVVTGGTLLVCLALPAMVDPSAFLTNAIRLPLGLEPVTLVARSPLPGFLLGQTGPAGHTLALLLLGTAGAAMAVWLWVRRPEDVVGAARRLSVGWLLAMCLAPSTRIGYLVYPLVLMVWLLPRSLRRFDTRIWNPLRFGNPFRRSSRRRADAETGRRRGSGARF